MLKPPTEHIHVIRHAREYRFGPGEWARAFSSIDWGLARCLSRKPNRAIWRATLELPTGPEELVLKLYAHVSLLDSVRSAAHMGRLRRQWHGAARLSRRGFPVARGRALLRGEREGARMDVLVMESAPGVPLIELLASGDLPVKTQHAVARQVGELVSLLDAERLHSKDLKPSNILVDLESKPPALTIIDSDTVGHRPAHPLLPLVLEPLGLGILPRRALLARVVKCWAWHEWLNAPFDVAADPDPASRYECELAREAWRDLQRLVRRHGDPTPEHNPLGARTPAARVALGPAGR